MNFKSTVTDTYVKFQIVNEKLDSSISAEIKKELTGLNEQGFKNLIMDLSLVKYCDSSGLSSILVGNRLCKNLSGIFVLIGANDMVSKLITISQLNSILNIAATETDALQFFKN